MSKAFTEKYLMQIARREIEEWSLSLPPGLVLAILFAFVHRATTGRTVEESFFPPPNDIHSFDPEI